MRCKPHARFGRRPGETEQTATLSPRPGPTSPRHARSSTRCGDASSKRSTGHRGRKNDPLYRIRNILRAGEENLTERQRTRLQDAWAADERHVEVEVAWLCAQQVRSAYHQPSHAAGRAIAQKILDTFASCPIPEVARLGKTLTQWRSEFLGYFDTDGASNGGTEAMNGLIELHRRIARGFRNRDNYRLRMLLIGGGLPL